MQLGAWWWMSWGKIDMVSLRIIASGSQVFKPQLLKPQMEVKAYRRLLATLMFNFSFRTQVCWLKEFYCQCIRLCAMLDIHVFVCGVLCLLIWLLLSGFCGVRGPPPQTVCSFYVCVLGGVGSSNM